MKYSIQACIWTEHDGTRNAFRQLTPSSDDGRISNIQYDCVDTVDPLGKVLIVNISFHVKSDRDGVVKSMKGLQGVIHACEDGSFVKTFKNWQDEAVNGIPPYACELETMLWKSNGTVYTI